MRKLIVLIPYYNVPKDLVSSITSIKESFLVDILLVDDGSEEKCDLRHIQEVYTNGSVYLLTLEQNQGIEKALNAGLNWIISKNYEFIGRLDAGDLCLPDRFGKQLNFLENNKEVSLVGTWVNMVNEQQEVQFVLKHPTSHHDITNKMYFNSCFVHPSVVFRVSVLSVVGLYPENRKAAEDYAFFFKITKHFKVANMDEVLLNYVISPNSISSLKRKQQIKSRLKVILDHFYFGFYPIVGLLRNSLLLMTSRGFIVGVKKLLTSFK